MKGLLIALFLALTVGFGVVYAVSRVKYDVAVNVNVPSVQAVGGTSISLNVEQGEAKAFAITLRNTSAAPVAVQFYADGVPVFLTLTCPTLCKQTLAPGDTVLTFTLLAQPSAPLGAAAFTITVGEPS